MYVISGEKSKILMTQQGAGRMKKKIREKAIGGIIRKIFSTMTVKEYEGMLDREEIQI